MPVGIAEIAIAVPSSSTSLKFSPRATPTTTMNATAPHAISPSTFVSEPSSFWSGERVRVTEVSIVAIWPIWVRMPVAVTTIAAVPLVTAVFWKSMFERSPSGDVGAREDAGVLRDRRALAGQGRLLRLERRGAEDPPVGGDDVAGLDLDDVARDEVDRRDERHRAVAHHLGLRHLQVRERVDAGPRLQLLPRAEDDVEEDEQRDDDAGRDLADREAHRRDGDEHDVHRIAELLQRHGPHRRRLLALDRVRAVAREPRRRLAAGQARCRIRLQRGDDVRRVAGVRRQLPGVGGLERDLCVSGHVYVVP